MEHETNPSPLEGTASSKSKYMSKFKRLAVSATVLLGIGTCTIGPCYSYGCADHVRTRITDAQMTKVDGRYMIATEYGAMRNEDALWRFKWNSGDVQNTAIKLKGKEVDIKKYGWRIHIPTRYENVISIDEVPAGK
jgi:hypothetical protein